MSAIQVKGLWTEGYAFEQYSLTSTYIGESSFGHPMYHNEYTPIGELIHRMKHNGHEDTSADIAAACGNFLKSWLQDKNISAIIPVPPTIKNRAFQPVFAIAERIGEIVDIPYFTDVIEKIDLQPIKNTPKEERDIGGAVVQVKPAKRKCNILLLDDVYSSGATANECTKVLQRDPLIESIYYFAIARTK